MFCITEERVREIFHEERAKEQTKCEHKDRGTYHENGTVTCDTCGKELQK